MSGNKVISKPIPPIIPIPTRKWWSIEYSPLPQDQLTKGLKALQSTDQFTRQKNKCFTDYVGNQHYFNICNEENQKRILQLADLSNPKHCELLVKLAKTCDKIKAQIEEILFPRAQKEEKLGDSSYTAVVRSSLSLQPTRDDEKRTTPSLQPSRETATAPSISSTYIVNKEGIINRLKEIALKDPSIKKLDPPKDKTWMLIKLLPLDLLIEWAKKDRDLAIIIFTNPTLFFPNYNKEKRETTLLDIYEAYRVSSFRSRSPTFHRCDDLQLVILLRPHVSPNHQDLALRDYWIPPEDAEDEEDAFKNRLHPIEQRNLNYLIYGDSKRPIAEFSKLRKKLIKDLYHPDYLKSCTERFINGLSILNNFDTTSSQEEKGKSTPKSTPISEEFWNILGNSSGLINQVISNERAEEKAAALALSLIRARAPHGDPRQREFAIKLITTGAFARSNFEGRLILPIFSRAYIAITKYICTHDNTPNIAEIWWKKTRAISEWFGRWVRTSSGLDLNRNPILLLPTYIVNRINIVRNSAHLRKLLINFYPLEQSTNIINNPLLWKSLIDHCKQDNEGFKLLFRNPLFFMKYFWPDVPQKKREEYFIAFLLGSDVDVVSKTTDTHVIDAYKSARGCPWLHRNIAIYAAQDLSFLIKIASKIVPSSTKKAKAIFLELVVAVIYELRNPRLLPAEVIKSLLAVSTHHNLLWFIDQLKEYALDFFKHCEKTIPPKESYEEEYSIGVTGIISFICEQIEKICEVLNDPANFRLFEIKFGYLSDYIERFLQFYNNKTLEPSQRQTMDDFLLALPLNSFISLLSHHGLAKIIKGNQRLKQRLLTERAELMRYIKTAESVVADEKSGETKDKTRVVTVPTLPKYKKDILEELGFLLAEDFKSIVTTSPYVSVISQDLQERMRSSTSVSVYTLFAERLAIYSREKMIGRFLTENVVNSFDFNIEKILSLLERSDKTVIKDLLGHLLQLDRVFSIHMYYRELETKENNSKVHHNADSVIVPKILDDPATIVKEYAELHPEEEETKILKNIREQLMEGLLLHIDHKWFPIFMIGLWKTSNQQERNHLVSVLVEYTSVLQSNLTAVAALLNTWIVNPYPSIQEMVHLIYLRKPFLLTNLKIAEKWFDGTVVVNDSLTKNPIYRQQLNSLWQTADAIGKKIRDNILCCYKGKHLARYYFYLGEDLRLDTFEIAKSMFPKTEADSLSSKPAFLAEISEEERLFYCVLLLREVENHINMIKINADNVWHQQKLTAYAEETSYFKMLNVDTFKSWVFDTCIGVVSLIWRINHQTPDVQRNIADSVRQSTIENIFSGIHDNLSEQELHELLKLAFTHTLSDSRESSAIPVLLSSIKFPENSNSIKRQTVYCRLMRDFWLQKPRLRTKLIKFPMPPRKTGIYIFSNDEFWHIAETLFPLGKRVVTNSSVLDPFPSLEADIRSTRGFYFTLLSNRLRDNIFSGNQAELAFTQRCFAESSCIQFLLFESILVAGPGTGLCKSFLSHFEFFVQLYSYIADENLWRQINNLLLQRDHPETIAYEQHLKKEILQVLDKPLASSLSSERKEDKQHAMSSHSIFPPPMEPVIQQYMEKDSKFALAILKNPVRLNHLCQSINRDFLIDFIVTKHSAMVERYCNSPDANLQKIGSICREKLNLTSTTVAVDEVVEVYQTKDLPTASLY